MSLRIERLDRGIGPVLDLAEEDVGEQLAGELELARADAVDVDHGDDAADDERELDEPELAQLSDFSGISEAPKSTARSLTRMMPASEPIGS